MPVRLTVLGSGTSHGIPMIACDCPVCTSDDPRDSRTRVSVVFHYNDHNVLVDCGPELRLQCVANKIDRRTKFFKTCQKTGQVVDSPALQHGAVVQWAQQEVLASGLTIDRDAVRALVDRSGTHLNDVENALTNVIDFVGGAAKSITLDDVNTACADVAEEEELLLNGRLTVNGTEQARLEQRDGDLFVFVFIDDTIESLN